MQQWDNLTKYERLEFLKKNHLFVKVRSYNIGNNYIDKFSLLINPDNLEELKKSYKIISLDLYTDDKIGKEFFEEWVVKHINNFDHLEDIVNFLKNEQRVSEEIPMVRERQWPQC